MKKKTLKLILTAAPGIAAAILLRLTGLISSGVTGLLLCFDIIGAIVGAWWMSKTEGITDKLLARLGGGND